MNGRTISLKQPISSSIGDNILAGMEDKSGETSEVRCWGNLIPEALGLIFSHLSLEEILTVVPSVCKSWSKVVLGPYCWQEIDIYDWSSGFPWRNEELDRMLQMLVTRSCGSFKKLCIHSLPSDLSFAFIANHAGSLQMLQLTRGKMSDSIVEQVADRLSKLTFLDLSDCPNIGAKALETFGKHCKSLSTLKRWIDPEELEEVCQDDEAHAISMTMPKLKQLEICFMLLTTGGVLEILSHCRELQFLDITGCSGVWLDGDFMKKNHDNVYVVGPHDALDDCFVSISDGSDFSDYDGEGYDYLGPDASYIGSEDELESGSDDEPEWNFYD